ncbi:MAG TPA: DUF2703 domain-containing protein [Desulfurivibrionaceae bacterium]|nr:DUF2703 domain-containing protein [Desulfurivibrionaceae bacterium]
MKHVTVEWRHLDQEGRTCERCAATGEGIVALLRDLQAECRPKGVEIIFTETKLTAAEIGESNLVLINGTPLESLLPMATAAESPCCSCSDLIGSKTCCRTLVWQGETHEAIPPELIRQAICRVAECC